ncbi:MAG: hypothetical protein R3195_06830 [Gemmatimonadota bacterium]|nr:hypothetical protein [Gemmatimonadota bacterium]
MSATIRADGDTWRARRGGREGERTIVFFCETTNQRPWRVVSIGDGEDVGEDLAELTEERLMALFERSTSMGAPTGYPTYGS